MNLEQLVLATRTCRRFHQYQLIAYETLLQLIDLARVGGSAKNLQPLKYFPVCDSVKNELIFRTLDGLVISRNGPAQKRANDLPPT